MKLCTLLITFTDGNNEVKQITTAHTFSSTDPRHYPQRRRVVHSNHREINNRNRNDDRSYVTISRSTDSPQGSLGSDMIERRPTSTTYQQQQQPSSLLLSPSSGPGRNNDLRQLIVQEVHLSYKCSNAETKTTQQNLSSSSSSIPLPRAGPLYVDYTTTNNNTQSIDENNFSEAAALIVGGEEARETMGQTIPMPNNNQHHYYGSESNLAYENKKNRKYFDFDARNNESSNIGDFLNTSTGDENNMMMYERESHHHQKHQDQDHHQRGHQRKQQQQQGRRGGSSESSQQRGHHKHQQQSQKKERFEEQYSFIQEESRNVNSHRISESVTKSMSYSRQFGSPRRHSTTTFESKGGGGEPYREDGIRLYARYDDDHNTTITNIQGGSDSPMTKTTTVFAPTKRKKIVEVEEERYRSIASGPPMNINNNNNQGWRVPKLPSNIASKHQREMAIEEHNFVTHLHQTTQKRKPIVLPIDLSKREKFDKQKRFKLPETTTTLSEINNDSHQENSIDFETYKREIERLKTESHRSQKNIITTSFHDGPEPYISTMQSSPPLPVSSPPNAIIIPPVRIHEEIIPQKIEYSETIISREQPIQQFTAKSVTEFPVYEPQIAIFTPPMPLSPQPQYPVHRSFESPPPPSRDMKVEEEAMRQFSEKLEILRNSKRFKHIEDTSQEFTFAPTPPPAPIPRPRERIIEQTETIEIETEEYRRVIPRKDQPELVPVTETITRTSEIVTKPRIPSPQPPPIPPLPVEEVILPPPIFSRPLSPPPPPPMTSSSSIDEHKRHIRVEVTEEILTERIERHRHRKINDEIHTYEKEIQVGHSAPEVIETATETIFLPSKDSSTQFDDYQSISHTTVDSYTQHDIPQFVDMASGAITPPTPEILLTPPSSPPPSVAEVITTERWTQMEERHFADVSTQEEVVPAPEVVVTTSAVVVDVVDSSTQSERPLSPPPPPPVVEKVEKGTDIIDLDQFVVQHESISHNTIIEEIINIDVHKHSIPQPPLPPTPPLIIIKEKSVEEKEDEESDSRFEERIEETTTVTTDTTTTMASKSKPVYESTLKEKPIPKRATPSTTTTTTAELKLKVSTPPQAPTPRMDFESNDFQSSITSRNSYVRAPRNLSPHVSGTSNRMFKVVSETTSMNSGISPFGGSTAALSIRDAREREKKEMSDLNDRLASYIEKVRFLEAQNRKIGADLDFLRSRWGHDTFNVREMYESEIKQAQKIIDDSNAERARLDNEVAKLVEEVATFRHKYDSAVRERATDKGVIDELLVKLSAIESELTLLKRRTANLEDDINATKRENHRLFGELQRARTEVDQETLNRIDYQNQVQTLIEELDFVRRAHESEIHDLQAMASRDTTSENREYFRNELAASIREIRAEYDQVCNVQRTDMESWYKLKVQEIQTQSVRANMEQGYTKDEMKRLRSQLGDLRGHLSDLEGRNALLEKQAEELHYQIEDDQRTYESALNDRDSQIRKLRDECHALMVELQMLLDTKQTLDAEIAIYRKMLEGEEDRAGLRQLVEQVVRTQQFRETQETESMRVLRGETSSRKSYQRSAQGNVSVQEASPEGKFIVVSNTHHSKSEPIGEWKLKRILDHKHEVVFTFPKSFVLKPGQSVKIWARGQGTNNPPESLIYNGAESFGTGNNVQTILYNTADEERATLIQRSSHTTTEH